MQLCLKYSRLFFSGHGVCKTSVAATDADAMIIVKMCLYVTDLFVVGSLSTMQVKELCRRQLLAKSSAAGEKRVAAGNKPSSAVSTPGPATPSFSVVPSPQASPANIVPSPSAAGIQQRSPFTPDEQLSRPVAESLRPMDSVSTRPLLSWHVPEASCVNSVGDVVINRSPRPASNSADSADGTASQQFAVVSSANGHWSVYSFDNFV